LIPALGVCTRATRRKARGQYLNTLTFQTLTRHHSQMRRADRAFLPRAERRHPHRRGGRCGGGSGGGRGGRCGGGSGGGGAFAARLHQGRVLLRHALHLGVFEGLLGIPDHLRQLSESCARRIGSSLSDKSARLTCFLAFKEVVRPSIGERRRFVDPAWVRG
jgi:hypothetical protein